MFEDREKIISSLTRDDSQEPILASLPARPHPIPPEIQACLAGDDLGWYQDSLRIPDQDVDPFFREVAKQMPGGRLVLGGGSDLVQLVMGVPKQFLQTIGEVNYVAMPLDGSARFFDSFREIEVEAPAFKERSEILRVQVMLNGESTYNIITMAANERNGRQLVDGLMQWALTVPIKHGYAAEVPAEGPVTLFFRTPEDKLNYLSKTLTLPGIRGRSVDEWIAAVNMKEEELPINFGILLHYAALVRLRGAGIGWHFDSQSLQFMRALADRMDQETKTWARETVEEICNAASFNISGKRRVFKELGIAA